MKRTQLIYIVRFHPKFCVVYFVLYDHGKRYNYSFFIQLQRTVHRMPKLGFSGTNFYWFDIQLHFSTLLWIRYILFLSFLTIIDENTTFLKNLIVLRGFVCFSINSSNDTENEGVLFGKNLIPTTWKSYTSYTSSCIKICIHNCWTLQVINLS